MTDRMIQSAGTQKSANAPLISRLPREFGFFSVLVFAMSCIAVVICGQLPLSMMAGLWPGVNLLLVLAIALIPCLLHAYVFSVIGSAVERSGADYYLASRVLPAPLAFASSWTFVFISGVSAGLLIALVPQTILPLFFRIAGMLGPQYASIASLGESVATTQNVVSIGTLLVVITFLLVMLPPRTVLNIMKVGFVATLAGWGVILFVLATSTAVDFPQAYDKVMGTGNYLNHLILAKMTGMTVVPSSTLTVVVGLFVGFWIFYGYTSPAYLSGEVKRPSRNLLGGSLVSLLLAGGILLATTYLMMRLVPAEWLAAESYLNNNGEQAMPWVLFYVAILRPNAILLGALLVVWIFSFINMAQAFIFYCSRVLTSWVDDDLLPQSFGYLHPTLHNPLVLILLVAIMAVVGVVISALTQLVTTQLDFVFFIIGAQLVPVLAVTIFPFTQKEWFNRSSSLVRLKIGPLPVITLAGAVTLGYMIWVLVNIIANPVLGGVSLSTVIVFAVVFITGLVWYAIRTRPARSQVGQPLEEPSAR